MLLAAFLDLLSSWRTAFPQQRTYQRDFQHALGTLACLGRRCLSRVIWTNGGQQQSWSGDCFLYSRRRWNAQQLFAPILRHGLDGCPGRMVGKAVDDTRLRKTGRAIPGTIANPKTASSITASPHICLPPCLAAPPMLCCRFTSTVGR